MNTTELLAQYRREAKDDAVPPFVSDSDVIGLYNEAVEEACIRRNLLFDATTATVAVINVVTGTATYDLDQSVVFINMAYLIDASEERIYLKMHDRDGMDRRNQDWREDTGEPEVLIVDETSLRLVPPPEEAYTLYLELYRVPLAAEKLTATNPSPSPAIASLHHRHLYHWVIYKGFSRPDADFFSPEKAEDHLKLFSKYFGPSVDADRKRCARENRPQVNALWI